MPLRTMGAQVRIISGAPHNKYGTPWVSFFTPRTALYANMSFLLIHPSQYFLQIDLLLNQSTKAVVLALNEKRNI